MIEGDDFRRFLTVPELAARWRISDRTVQRLIKRGALPHLRIGRQVRLGLDDILAFERTGARNVK